MLQNPTYLLEDNSVYRRIHISDSLQVLYLFDILLNTAALLVYITGIRAGLLKILLHYNWVCQHKQWA